MLTVKHIRKGHGLTSDDFEFAVYECYSYVLSYPRNPPGARDPNTTRVTLEMPTGGPWAIDLQDGEEFYMMNSAGKTIDHVSLVLAEQKA